VIIRELSDRDAREAALVENLQREDLNIIDEVDAKLGLVSLTLDIPREDVRGRMMQLLTEEPGPDGEALTKLFSTLKETWESFAKNKLRILNWPDTVVDAMRGGLPYTHAAVIVSAPPEHQAHLLELAAQGQSRSELREEVARLKQSTSQASAPVHRVVQVGKHLTSRRLLARLQPADLKALERWLDKMPANVRQLLESEFTEK